MKTLGRTIALLFLLAGAHASAGKNTEIWLSPEPSLNADSGTPIPSADICEVSDPQFPTALPLLEKNAIVPISKQTAENLVGSCIRVESTKSLFLVRAVYGHRGTGRYFVRQVGNSLLVVHGSLGRNTIYNRSALVVSLPFKPQQLFVKVGIDQ
mgnify:CR=1 FL=1